MKHPLAEIMDKDGMLPQHNCKQCGAPLNADGYHPAELYAGTYTGLCYKCQNAGARIVGIHTDGAHEISYAPDCPSWRRDRHIHTAYLDCPDCKGTGRVYVSRASSQGGSYHTSCATCTRRFYDHPSRKARQHMHDAMRQAAQDYYHSLLRKAKLIAKARKGTAPEEKIAPLRLAAQLRYGAYLERYHAVFNCIVKQAQARAA